MGYIHLDVSRGTTSFEDLSQYGSRIFQFINQTYYVIQNNGYLTLMKIQDHHFTLKPPLQLSKANVSIYSSISNPFSNVFETKSESTDYLEVKTEVTKISDEFETLDLETTSIQIYSNKAETLIGLNS